jgi:benzoylsuccinyl-CoA thiolase BbsB subunit
MREVKIVGVGMMKFGKYLDKRISDLGREACWKAIQDAGVNPGDVQVAYCGHNRQGSVAGQRVLVELGMTGIPITNVENACSSGASALREAFMVIAGGFYDIALVIGVEKLYGKVQGALSGSEEDLEIDLGLVQPALYALRAKRHMELYGTTSEQLAKIAVKNHHNGCLNPYAQYQKEITVGEVLSSRLIADPLHLLDCCPIGDGAAAAILCSAEAAKKYRGKAVTLAASTLSSGTIESGYTGIELTKEELTIRAAKEAYEKAGVGPEDIDVAEVHDCFTIAEMTRIENLGLCKPGEAGKLIDEGATEIGGRIPVNTSGGLLSKGHPLGATGVAQVAEIVWQLRGQAGQRQVQGAKVGLAHCRGGSVAGTEGGSCTIQVLKI